MTRPAQPSEDDQVPKRWDRKRRRERDRSLWWRAFWGAVAFFFLALAYWSFQYGVPWPP